MATKETDIKLREFRPLGDKIFVTEIEQGMQKTAGGIILTDDNFKEHGIRPRWAQIVVTGPRATEEHSVSVGEWVLVEHGRWTLGMGFTGDNGEQVRLWMIDPKGILLVSTDDPRENTRFSL
jgi:co-chaperonin GroES (HSP10)